MSYSRWLKTDLHIHSHISKQTKENDYDGADLTYVKLFEALKREEVNLFSITDHNTINIPLYAELIERNDELVSNKINFIIGAEIDFLDTEIHEKVFHMLVYFNTKDLIKVSNVLTDIFNKGCLDEIDKNISPITLNTFFKSVFQNEIHDIITIPHFNNKDKGIPPKDQIDKFVYTVFSALEDSNNRNNLIKSIGLFKNFDYNDVPIVVFSDNHNIEVYPCGKNVDKSKQTSMYILGNVNYPFNSIKSAFQDVNTRMSIDNIELRSKNSINKYIKMINLDDNIIQLSKYQNTIIGGFGTGKSFLLDMIINGKSNVNNRYNELSKKYESFSITFSDGTTRSSLYELIDEVKIIRFDQYKDIYFKTVLMDEDKKVLENNLHIKFPELNIVDKIDEIQIKDSFNQLKENYTQTLSITDIISYEAIARRNEKAYSLNQENLPNLYDEPMYMVNLQENLNSEVDKKVLGNYVYSEGEKEKISLTKSIITQKNNDFINLSSNIEKIIDKVGLKILNINETAHRSNINISSNIKIFEDIKEDIKTYINMLKDLRYKSYDFEKRYSKEEYDDLKNLRIEKDLYNYKLIAQYKADEINVDYKTEIFKAPNRKSNLFYSIITTLNNNDTFTQNHTFAQRVDNFTNRYYSNFNTICYDIYENDISIMKKSAGEKANTIISIIFNIIEDYSSQNISSIVILDQPEDNLDNRGIQKEVVNRIRNMKSNNHLPQLICVTHNANISITADSENIILARKLDGKCIYVGSGIEDIDFIQEVCMIVEGGSDALKKRGTKFNLPIIKELDRGV